MYEAKMSTKRVCEYGYLFWHEYMCMKCVWMGMCYCKVFVYVSKNVRKCIIAVDKYMYLYEESICMSECDLLKCKCEWMNYLRKAEERELARVVFCLYIYIARMLTCYKNNVEMY